MKFILRTQVTPTGWQVQIESLVQPALGARQIGQCGAAGEHFPDPLDAPPDIRALCQAPEGEPPPVQFLYERCRAGAPDTPRVGHIGDVELFGRYLAAVLLGPHWDAMERAAGQDDIALMLQFEPNDAELARLPWEMMFGSQVPLAAIPQRNVAITRVIGGEKVIAEPVARPLRVLFVVGRQLDDALRPGAEYFGLLRYLKNNPEAQASEAELNVRLLPEATTDELEVEMSRFRPHVVHFICHGALDPDGAKLLLTKRETEDRTSAKSLQPKRCDADTLFGLLGPAKDADGQMRGAPSVVVLNACHGGDAPGVMDEASAEGVCQSCVVRLVSLGIPMAIGMTGEVADGACRIFTRSFYRALLNEQCVALAAAKGRRAAMLHYDNYRNNVEWARAILCVREAEATRLRFEPLGAGARSLASVLSKYRQNSEPLFDRLECLREYEAFRVGAHEFCSRVARGEPSAPAKVILAFGVEADEGSHPVYGRLRFGKTPLLCDLAAQSVVDGLVPCLLPSRNVDPPAHVGDFALRLAEAMNDARRSFGIPSLARSRSLELAADMCGVKLPQDDRLENIRLAIGRIRGLLRGVKMPLADLGRTFKAAIAADFRRLRKDFDDRAHPWVLIDDLDRYEGVLGVLAGVVLDSYGLGGDLDGGERIVVPLIFTHSTKTGVGRGPEEIRKLLAGLPDTARRVPLVKLGAVEERLAFDECLLSLPRLVANTDRSYRQNMEMLVRIVSDAAQGVPSVLLSSFVAGMVKLAKEQRVLLDADEEAIFKKLPPIE